MISDSTNCSNESDQGIIYWALFQQCGAWGQLIYYFGAMIALH